MRRIALLALVVSVLTGCGSTMTSRRQEVDLSTVFPPGAATATEVCKTGEDRLLHIARDYPFSGADVTHERLLLEEGARQSASSIRETIHELAGVKAPSALADPLRAAAESFTRVARRLHAQHGENAFPADAKLYTLAGLPFFQACHQAETGSSGAES